jgi:hypothetical protein
MMTPSLPMLRKAVAKAEQAYGQSICQDLDKAIGRLQMRHDWMDRCMKAMSMNIPKQGASPSRRRRLFHASRHDGSTGLTAS